MPIRRLVAATSVCLLLTACTSWATAVACADPPLVLSSSDSLTGDSDWVLRYPDGRTEDMTPTPTGHEPVLSPDGHAVAFALGVGPFSDSFGWEASRVAVLPLESRDVRVLSADVPDAIVWGLQWSADGSEVAFLRHTDDSTEVVAVEIEKGTERPLLRLDEGQGTASWSPDGRELLVVTPGPEKTALWRYSIETGAHSVIPTPHTWIQDISWSSDGRRVAMEADIPEVGRLRLYVLDLETGDSRPVDRRRGGPTSISWSGPYLFYTYYDWTGEDQVVLRRWDSTTGERSNVSAPGIPDPVFPPAWDATVSAPRCG
jgi:Tol biopolymer transport system component